MTDTFGPCEICGARDWSIVYRGDVRDGVFGRSRPDVTVGHCGGCGADRLDENFVWMMHFMKPYCHDQRNHLLHQR
jgi:hypothetical protein